MTAPRNPPRPDLLARALDAVERIGNALPHLATDAFGRPIGPGMFLRMPK